MVRELTQGYVQTRVFMDTTVVIELCAPGLDDEELYALTESAFSWFREVERRCSRFDEDSELRQLSRRIGEPTRTSPLVFQALRMALEIAQITDGALDPTVGGAMERAGFATNYVTGATVKSEGVDGSASFRDVVLEEDGRTVTLRRPLSLDLGAIAKGLAIDLAAQELAALPGSVVNAGGDIRASGLNPNGDPWQIGIRHPRRDDELLTCLNITNAAVCTSGDYERTSGGKGHIIHPKTNASVAETVSATVIAPHASVADGLSTAVFVLGAEAGMALLEREGIEGLIVRGDLGITATPGMSRYGFP